MSFFANVNWETVITVAVPGLIIFLGTVYNDIRKKKNAQIDTNNAVTVKREPTWVELEESNRKLRAEMAAQKEESDGKYDELTERFNKFEQKTNVRIAALSNMLHATSVQWPLDAPGPYFDAADLAALEHTDVPYVWRNRVRPHG